MRNKEIWIIIGLTIFILGGVYAYGLTRQKKDPYFGISQYTISYHDPDFSVKEKHNTGIMDGTVYNIYREVEIEVQGVLKGELPAEITVSVLEADMSVGCGSESICRDQDTRSISKHEGFPKFTQGEEIILFLYKTGSLNSSSLMVSGSFQGKFVIKDDRATNGKLDMGVEQLMNEARKSI